MKLHLFTFFGIIFMSLTNSNLLYGQETGSITPPEAEIKPRELTIHNHTRIDNYYWLNDRENPQVIDYLIKENEYTDKVLGHTKELQDKLYNEIIKRIKQNDASVPYRDNGYYYYSRYEEGKEYPIHCRKKGNLDAPEEIMLDVNILAEGYSYFNVSGLNVSPDNRLLAYGVDTLSRRIYDIHFKDLTTGEVFTQRIPGTTGGSVWANDSKTLYYSIKDETLRPYKIIKHSFGTDAVNDSEIYHEDDPAFTSYIYKTKSDKYIIIGSFSTLSAEIRFIDADNPDAGLKIIQPRGKELEYSVDHFGDKFYIKTNYEAKNFRLMEAPVSDPGISNWKEVIPHREKVLLEGIEIFKNYLVVQERENGLTGLHITRWDKSSDHYLDFGEETYMAFITTNTEFDTEVLRFGYTSLTTPFSQFDYNMNTREKVLLKQDEVLGDFDPVNYQSERIYATADDGTSIPISLVYRKGIEKNSSNPLLLYAYGSYGLSTDPAFSSVRLSLLDRGFIFAIAHVRGGQELGRAWYEDGKLFKKKNTFTDFINCAEYLIEQKYTNREKLFASGGSAGGLLIGAVANMRPDLFKGLIAGVPFVDVVTTMLDESIPLTTGEYDEWGNPNVKEYYDYILSYSPYDNVKTADYPAMLVTTGLHDSQVQYWEPAKWVAKLRKMKTDNNMLLLHTNMSAGHGGASGRFERYKRTALEYAFLLNLVNINE